MQCAVLSGPAWPVTAPLYPSVNRDCPAGPPTSRAVVSSGDLEVLSSLYNQDPCCCSDAHAVPRPSEGHWSLPHTHALTRRRRPAGPGAESARSLLAGTPGDAVLPAFAAAVPDTGTPRPWATSISTHSVFSAFSPPGGAPTGRNSETGFQARLSAEQHARRGHASPRIFRLKCTGVGRGHPPGSQ